MNYWQAQLISLAILERAVQRWRCKLRTGEMTADEVVQAAKLTQNRAGEHLTSNQRKRLADLGVDVARIPRLRYTAAW